MSDGWSLFLQVLKRVLKGILVGTTKGLICSLTIDLVSVKCMNCGIYLIDLTCIREHDLVSVYFIALALLYLTCYLNLTCIELELECRLE